MYHRAHGDLRDIAVIFQDDVNISEQRESSVNSAVNQTSEQSEPSEPSVYSGVQKKLITEKK